MRIPILSAVLGRTPPTTPPPHTHARAAAPVVVGQLQRPLQRRHVVQGAGRLEGPCLPVGGQQLLDEAQADAVSLQLQVDGAAGTGSRTSKAG